MAGILFRAVKRESETRSVDQNGLSSTAFRSRLDVRKR